MDNNLEQEKTLIQECKKDIKVFEKLYNKYTNDVYRYIYVVVKNKEIAEDITSQAFLTAIEKVRDFEWRGISIKYWFLKIARNLVSKQISKPKDISFDEKFEVRNLNKMLVEDVVVEKELKDKLKELIFKLDDTTREIISLRIWDDLKFKEISELLDMNESTVKNRFARGVKKLQKMLEEDIKEAQIRREKGKKLYSVNIVSIIVGIKYLKRIPEFLPSKEFINNLAIQITNKIKLIIKNINMDTQNVQDAQSSTQSGQSTSPSMEQVASTTKGLALAGKKLYIALGILGVATVAGIGGVAWYITSTDGDTEPDTTQEITEESDETSTTDTTEEPQVTDTYEGWETYTNSVYNFSFKYPSDWTIIQEEGEPYVDPALSGGEVNYGFTVTLSKGNWEYKVVYEPYVDDVTGDNVPVDPKEVVISGQERMRVVYDNFDQVTNKVEDRLFKINIMEISYYQDHKDYSYWETAIDVGGKNFIIEYEPTTDVTLEDSKSDIAIMDKISESLDLTSSTQDPYEGWNTYKDQDDRISLRYPSEWNLSESEYNPLAYTISITSKSGHSIIFYAAEGDYGNYCIYSDTDTSNMPEDYINGIIGKKELSSYEEFSNNNKKYRRSPTGDQEHEELVCIYDEQSSFFISYIPSVGIVKYIVSGEVEKDLEDLKLILFSAE